jgi:succinyl-CoA synthetase alpha subunit
MRAHTAQVGGTLEYDVVDAVRAGKLRKPLISWCIGTCADHITSEVQFGHAGASAYGKGETASEKNHALAAAGCAVPASFDDLGALIK